MINVRFFLTRSKSYLHGPGPDTALRRERWWHERLRCHVLPGLWCSGCRGAHRPSAELRCDPELRINSYSGLYLEISPAGPKPLSLGCQLFAVLKRERFLLSVPKGWLVEDELVAKGILKFSWIACLEGSSPLKGIKGDFGHLTGQLTGTPWDGPICSGPVGCPGLINLIPLQQWVSGKKIALPSQRAGWAKQLFLVLNPAAIHSPLCSVCPLFFSCCHHSLFTLVSSSACNRCSFFCMGCSPEQWPVQNMYFTFSAEQIKSWASQAGPSTSGPLQLAAGFAAPWGWVFEGCRGQLGFPWKPGLSSHQLRQGKNWPWE